MADHVIVCGYGTRGQEAVRTLLAQGRARNRIVVVERDPAAAAVAETAELPTVTGDAARSEVLIAAGVEQAAAVIVTLSRDDTAVMACLTAREHNPQARVAVSVTTRTRIWRHRAARTPSSCSRPRPGDWWRRRYPLRAPSRCWRT